MHDYEYVEVAHFLLSAFENKNVQIRTKGEINVKEATCDFQNNLSIFAMVF